MIKLVEFVRDFLKCENARHKTVNLFAFVFNICYIYFNLISGIIYENILSVTASAYYIIIIFIRYLVMGEKAPGDTPELAYAANIAVSLLRVAAFPITGIILYTLLLGNTREYPVWILTVIGIYSFTAILRAILGLFRFEKTKSMRAAYSARLSAAFLSLFNFQVSFLAFLHISSKAELSLNLISGSIITLSVFYLAFVSLRS